MLVPLVTAISLVLPASMAGAVTSPVASVRAVTAPAQEDPEVFASVKVDAEGFGEVGSKVSTRVVAEAETTLEAEGIKRRTGVDDIVVFLKVTPPPSGDEGYMLGIAVTHLGQPITETIEADCELCVEDELIELVDAKIRELLPKIREHMAQVQADAAAAAAEAQAEEPEPEPEIEPPPPIVEEEPKGMGGKGKAGAALLGLGAAGAVAGVIMAVRPPTQISPDNGYELRRTQPPGYATLAVGGALLVTGAVLLVLDSRERKRSRPKATSVAPMLSPSVAGLSWSGRF